MLRAIDRRLHNDYATQASFHGIKIPLKHLEPAPSDVPDSAFDPKIAQRALEEASTRVRARYGR